MTTTFWMALSALFMVSACASVAPAPGDDPSAFIAIDQDADFPVTIPAAYGSTRGYLTVPEVRDDPASRMIRLPVAIVHAQSGPSDLPPVVYLAGGPGVGSLLAAAYPGAYPWTADRDFIVLGQRGTHHAEPALTCPEFISALSDAPDDKERHRASVDTCRGRLGDIAELSAYHTAASAADIEDLRRALGHDTVALYGLSYGTRLALTYARDFADRVDAMVLDSPLPHTARYDDESVDHYRAVLEAISAACAAQPACAAAFPDLWPRYAAAVTAAQTTPWQTADGRMIGAADLARIVSLRSPRTIAEAPRLMNAVATGDIQTVAEATNTVRSPMSFAWGMRFSVWCGEAYPFSAAARGDERTSFGGLSGAAISAEYCQIWNVPARPISDRAPTTGPVPTLIIAGEYDALTPPIWARQTAEALDNAWVAIIPQGGHTETTNWGGDGCAMSLAATFFATTGQGAPYTMNNDCLGARAPITFTTP